MLEAWRARRAEERRLRVEQAMAVEARRRRTDLAARRIAIEDELSFAQQRLDAARGFHGVTGDDVPDASGVLLKKDESVYCVATGAVLIEPRRGRGHWKGFNQGVSVPIPGTRLRYRVGASTGSFQMGEESPTPIDTGTFVVTSTRGVFTGQKQSREWQWSKLLGVTHHDPGWTAMAVSNREKVSGVGVDSQYRDSLAFWVDLAVARATDTVDEVEADCLDDIAQLRTALDELDTLDTSSGPPDAIVSPTSPSI